MAGVAAAVLATLTAMAAVGASCALAVTPPLSVTTQFEDGTISLSSPDAIGYALVNTSGTSQTVSFTDTLPAGVTIDSPTGLTNTAGVGTCTNLTVNNPSSGQPTASGDGAVTVTVTVPSVSTATSSKPVCTIALSVVAASPSIGDVALADSYSDRSPSTLFATPGKLVVLTNPTLRITAPSSGQSFTLGQVFNANFACAAADPLDSIDSFFGTDDEGNQIQSGAPIDTLDPGKHSLEVDCYSAVGGGDLTQTVNYRVGSYALGSLKVANKTDQVSFRTQVPAGKLLAVVLEGKKKVGTTTVKVNARKRVSVTVKPTPAGRKVLAGGKGKTAKVSLQVSFKPNAIGSGDTQINAAAATVVTKSLKLPIAHAAARSK